MVKVFRFFKFIWKRKQQGKKRRLIRENKSGTVWIIMNTVFFKGNINFHMWLTVLNLKDWKLLWKFLDFVRVNGDAVMQLWEKWEKYIYFFLFFQAESHCLWLMGKQTVRYHVVKHIGEYIPLMVDLCCCFLVFTVLARVVILHQLAHVFSHHVVVHSACKLLLWNTHKPTGSNVAE